MLYKVNLVGKNCNANSVKVLASGDRDGFKSLTLRKLKRSNQSRISVADLKYLSLPKRSWRIKHLYTMMIYISNYKFITSRKMGLSSTKINIAWNRGGVQVTQGARES